jgi:enoyl-CoA hydratase/carnithine racemase
MGEFVSVQVTDSLATIRLDRPPMNAINTQVQAELGQAAAAIATNPDIRAAILYGGEKIFAAGADVKEMLRRVSETRAKSVAEPCGVRGQKSLRRCAGRRASIRYTSVPGRGRVECK